MDQTKINEQIKSIVNKDRQIRSYFAGMAQALRLLNKGLSFKSYPNINIIGLKLCLPEFLLELSAQPDQLKDDGTGSHHSKPKQQQNH